MCLLQAWKCAEIVFGLRPHWGAYSAPPDSLAGGRGPNAPPQKPQPASALGTSLSRPRTPKNNSYSYALAMSPAQTDKSTETLFAGERTQRLKVTTH